jgi:hypothetical protein
MFPTLRRAATDYSISVYDFAYVRCNRAQNLPQIEARRDFGRQIEKKLKPLLLMPRFPLSADGRMRRATHFLMDTFNRIMIQVARESQEFGCHKWRARNLFENPTCTSGYAYRLAAGIPSNETVLNNATESHQPYPQHDGTEQKNES